MEPEQVRNIMDSMIRKLYDMELEELGRSGWQDEIVDCVKPDLVSSWYLAQSF